MIFMSKTVEKPLGYLHKYAIWVNLVGNRELKFTAMGEYLKVQYFFFFFAFSGLVKETTKGYFNFDLHLQYVNSSMLQIVPNADFGMGLQLIKDLYSLFGV